MGKFVGGEWSCIRRKTEKQGTKEGRAKADRSMDPRGEVGDPIMGDTITAGIRLYA